MDHISEIGDPEALPGEKITETVEELRAKLESMRSLLANSQREKEGKKRGGSTKNASIIDGTFLSAIFGVVLVLIVGVSFYAFQNLFWAINKKFNPRHTEL
ncbi:hypothetical protein LSTR_LSTR005441 [Laodelphax striatellus]|uniref:Uncharacterized protein n=1 Tax=Laodelphax striatellus TaxID=195883 RepID=A0A482WXP6_LAOST|nr:hypothetical protein LSTR_LSTR005441 [Laodelphax striatellus]